MSRELRFIFVPLGSAGDINPLVWLARLMAERGHEVVIVMQTAMAEHGHRARLRTVPVGAAEEQEAVVRNPDIWHPRRGFRLLAQHFPEWAREMVPAIRHELVPGRTVVIGAGIAFGARIVAELERVPLVTAQLQPCIFMSPHDCPVAMRGMEHLKRWPLWLRRLVFRISNLETDRLLRKPINRLRADLGLHQPVSGILSRWAQSPDLVLALFPEWFGPRQPDWPSQTRLARFPLYDEAEGRPVSSRLEDFLRAGPPPILLTPGSANMHARQFFDAGLAACRALGRRALLLTPFTEQLPASILPPHLHVDFAPFSRVFPRCAAVVHHGGIGTCAQGLAAGVPQLIMAMSHDQPDNGWRLRQLGVGRYLYPNQFTAPKVTSALRDLLESAQVARACQDARQQMDSQIPVETVGELLENFAARHLGTGKTGKLSNQ